MSDAILRHALSSEYKAVDFPGFNKNDYTQELGAHSTLYSGTGTVPEF